MLVPKLYSSEEEVVLAITIVPYYADLGGRVPTSVTVNLLRAMGGQEED